MTIFWRNKVITPLAKFLILATGFLGAAHLLLTILGRYRTEFGLIDTNSIFSLKEIFQLLRASCDTEWLLFTISLRLPTFVRPFLQSFSGGIYNMCLVLRSSRSGRDLAPLLSRASQRNYSSELFNPCLCSYQPRSSHSCCPDKLLKYICARIWQQGLREMPFFDHMERRERIMMDEEENRQVYVPACDKSLLEVHVNP